MTYNEHMRRNVQKLLTDEKITTLDIKKSNDFREQFKTMKLPFSRSSNFVNKKVTWEIIDKSNLEYYLIGVELYNGHHFNGALIPWMKSDLFNPEIRILRIIENKRHERSVAMVEFKIVDKKIIIVGFEATGNILRNITKQAMINFIEYVESNSFKVEFDVDKYNLISFKKLYS